mmetsp:Transcript_60580/g.141092  ORF Transcript_60580/g.141092 Transcript_60580/m.141092 type:complete len:332 (+) Transcript_60580:65-1060(+)
MVARPSRYRAAKRRSSKQLALVAATVVLAVLHATTAFAMRSPMRATIERPASLGALRSPSASALDFGHHTSSKPSWFSVAGPQCVGWSVLLWACAAWRRSTPRTRTAARCARGIHVVAGSAPGQLEVTLTQKQPELPAPHGLAGTWHAPVGLQWHGESPDSPPLRRVVKNISPREIAPAAVSQERSENSSAGGPQLRAKAATFVGGARRARSASRREARSTASRTSRAAHRSAGARLRARIEHPVVLKPAYDPSRLPTRLQVGLQVTLRTPSASLAQTKTQSTSSGVNDQSGIFIATYFEGSGRNRNMSRSRLTSAMESQDVPRWWEESCA